MEETVPSWSIRLWAQLKMTPPSNAQQTVIVQILPVCLFPPNRQIWSSDNRQPTNTTPATTMAICKITPTAHLHQLPPSVLYQNDKTVPWKADHLPVWL